MRRHPAFARVDHRPWPVPSRPWSWSQTWLDLAFIHWDADAEQLRGRVPSGLELDLFDGRAWIGIVPFDMKNVARRPWPALPGCRHFPEINVRTYVTRDGKPGVWFFSLHVPHRAAVWVARRWFHLPYHYGKVSCRAVDDSIHYRLEAKEHAFEAVYAPLRPRTFKSGSFEIWATERYCLYSQSPNGTLYRAEVQHAPWPLQEASLEILSNKLLQPFAVGSLHPSILFSERLDVAVWPLTAL